MQIIESFVAITHRVIARDGFDEYLPTLMLPATHDLLVLEGAPQDSTLCICHETAGVCLENPMVLV
jgi:hypothetical protein